MLLLYVREFTELQKQQASTTKMLEALAALLQKVGDTIGGQASRLERERADRDEVQDRLSHLVDHVATPCSGCAMPTVMPARPCRPSS